MPTNETQASINPGVVSESHVAKDNSDEMSHELLEKSENELNSPKSTKDMEKRTSEGGKRHDVSHSKVRFYPIISVSTLTTYY